MSSSLLFDLQACINTNFVIEGYARRCSEHILSILASTGIALLDLDHDDPVASTIFDMEESAHEAGTLIYTLLDQCSADTMPGKNLPEKISRLCALFSEASGWEIVPEVSPGIERALLSENVLMLSLVNLLAARVQLSPSAPIHIQFLLVRKGKDDFDSGLVAPDYRDGMAFGLRMQFPEVARQTLIKALQGKAVWNRATSTAIDGLALLLEGVRSQQGGVSVHSLSKSEGAVIELFFPQTGIDESELSAEDDTSSRRAADRKPGVLFIDDDPLVCAVTERILARKGFVVHTAESGAQGLDLYQSKKDDIAVAIIDLNMPDMNGEQVVQQMLKLGLLVPVVATSGADEQLDAAYLRQVGFCDIISKPYSAGDLADKINHVLQQAVH